jgi:hypothetical protein
MKRAAGYDPMREFPLGPGSGRNAQIAGAAGRFGRRVLSSTFPPFPLAAVRRERATSGRSGGNERAQFRHPFLPLAKLDASLSEVSLS